MYLEGNHLFKKSNITKTGGAYGIIGTLILRARIITIRVNEEKGRFYPAFFIMKIKPTIAKLPHQVTHNKADLGDILTYALLIIIAPMQSYAFT